MRRKKTYWVANQAIREPELRVIGKGGKQIGVIKTAEALSKAKKAGLDLVIVARGAKPPVARITDLGKFKYKEEKKQQAERKKTKQTELKEVRFSPFIAENDYRVRIERIEEFLSESNKVRVVVVFKGRQMGSKPFGYKLIKKILGSLGHAVVIDMEPKFLGRHLVTIISPTKKRYAKTKN